MFVARMLTKTQKKPCVFNFFYTNKDFQRVFSKESLENEKKIILGPAMFKA